jgi:predicted  nucleic acid-binding Zn-ribbon protein
MAPLEPSKVKYDKLFGGHNISYCPRCGVNLFSFYAKERNIEDYVNEIEGDTF